MNGATMTRLEAIREIRSMVQSKCGQLYLRDEANLSVDYKTGKLVYGYTNPNDGEYDEVILSDTKDVHKFVRKTFEREPLVYVNAYAVHRVYGGPEEGGWWYDMYEVLSTVPVIKRKDNVERVVEILRESLGPEYEQPHGRTRFSAIGGPDLEITVQAHPGENSKPMSYG